MKLLLRFFVYAFLTSFLYGQAPPLAAPFIKQVSPASLALGSTTLTLTGANFNQNATVNLAGPGGSEQSTSTTVNSSGTQIVASFSSFPVTSTLGTVWVTVTNPSGEVSNVVYLAVTAPTPTVKVQSNSGFPLSASPSAVVAGDFNNDGNIDLAVANQSSGSVLVMLGTTSGTLYPGNTYAVGRGPAGIASGDFNGDGKLDLVVANAQDETLTILLGNGDGTFTTNPSAPPTGAYPASIAVADFNGDGKLDLAVVNMCGSDPVMCYPAAPPHGPFLLTILLGNGDGTFTASPTPPSVGNQPSYMTLGDFNGDGLIDLAVSNMGDNTVTILMGNGDGTFTPTTNSPSTGAEPQGLVAADFNGDGALDLAVVNQIGGTVSILLNQNCPSVTALNCTFAAAKPALQVGNSPMAIATADLNGDGILDLVVANSADNTISVLLGNGSGGFSAVVPQNGQNFATPPRPNSLILADLNRDGRIDVVTFGGGYSVMLQSTVAAINLAANNAPTITYGNQIYLTATLSRPAAFPFLPTGTISFMDGATTLGTASVDASGQVVYQTNTLSTGTHQITAVYSGDYYYAGITSAPLAQTVLQAQANTVLTSSANPAGSGQAITLLATIQIPSYLSATGTVAFQDLSTSTNLGTATVSNNSAQIVVSNLSNATHSILATYSGDANFASSTSRILSQTVTQATTTLSLTSSLSSSSYGQAVALTATIQPSYAGGSASGTVSFYDNGTLWQTAPLTNNVAQISVTGFAVGTHSLTATYGGDANFTGSSASAVTLTVSQAATTTTLTSNANPSTYGQSVTLTATVQPPTGTSATGTITFMDGSTSLGSATLAANSAQISLASLGTGTHSITAVYGGDTNIAGSTSAPVSQQVNQASTTTTLSSSLNPSSFGQTITFTATVQTPAGITASGNVTFFDGSTNLGSVSVSSNSAQIAVSSLSVGTHSIAATYAGNSNLLASTSLALSQAVNGQATTTVATSSTNPSSFGQSITFSASIQPALGGNVTGTVTFLDGTTTLRTSSVSSNAAQLTVSSLSVGVHSITARYSGDTNYITSTSSAFTQTVSQAAATTRVSSNLNPAVLGQSITFTVSVQATSGTPTGTVTLMDGSTSLGTTSLTNGTAQFTIAGSSAGSHSITASYSGDTNYSASTSAVLSEVVNQATTTTTISSSINPSSYSQAVTFTASITPSSGSSPTGTVQFFDGTVQLGSAALSGGIATFTTSALNAGSHSVTATYSGDPNFKGSTSSPLRQTVNSIPTVTMLTSNLNPSITGQTVTFTASVSSNVSGSQSGTVNFYLDGSTTPAQSSALSGNMATFSSSSLTLGNHTVNATFVSSNANFQGSSSTTLTQSVRDFSISSSPTSRTISRGHSGTYTLTLTPLNGFTGTVALSCSGAPSNTTCTASPSQVTLSGTSSVQSTVTVSVAKNATTGTRTLTLSGTAGSVTHSVTVSLTIN